MISTELASQTMSKRVMQHVAIALGRTKWEDKYNVHDLTIEAWDAGIWVKQLGLISYRDLAVILMTEARIKTFQLPVQKRGENLFIVSSFQDMQKKYAVTKVNNRYVCHCMKYKCWQKRMSKECPKLYKALDCEVFCHHTVAAALA